MKKILIIEDDYFLVEACKTKFENAGYTVESAQNGEEGLEKISDYKPDLILLDLLMPIMDGFEVLKKLKQDDNTKDIPVMMITNLWQEDDRDQALALGATDYVVKSNIALNELVQKVDKLVN